MTYAQNTQLDHLDNPATSYCVNLYAVLCSLVGSFTTAIDEMPAAAYEIRAGGDVKNKKQSMADLKLRRLNELNSRLKEDLERPRIRVSEASMSWVHFFVFLDAHCEY